MTRCSVKLASFGLKVSSSCPGNRFFELCSSFLCVCVWCLLFSVLFLFCSFCFFVCVCGVFCFPCFLFVLSFCVCVVSFVFRWREPFLLSFCVCLVFSGFLILLFFFKKIYIYIYISPRGQQQTRVFGGSEPKP